MKKQPLERKYDPFFAKIEEKHPFMQKQLFTLVLRVQRAPAKYSLLQILI